VSIVWVGTLPDKTSGVNTTHRPAGFLRARQIRRWSGRRAANRNRGHAPDRSAVRRCWCMRTCC